MNIERAATLARHSKLSNERHVSVEALLHEYNEALVQLRRVSPDKAKTIEAQLITAEALRGEATAAVIQARHILGQLSDSVVGRASHRQELMDAESKLTLAQNTLADKSSLALSDGDLVRLDQEIKHLPGGIKELRATIAKDTAELEKQAAAAGIDLAQLIRVLVADAGPGPDGRYPSAQHILDLNRLGFLS